MSKPTWKSRIVLPAMLLLGVIGLHSRTSGGGAPTGWPSIGRRIGPSRQIRSPPANGHQPCDRLPETNTPGARLRIRRERVANLVGEIRGFGGLALVRRLA